MFSKVKTLEDAAIMALGLFTLCVGAVVFLAIASVIVKTAEHLDKLMF